MKNMINFILNEERSVFKERFKYVFKRQNGGMNIIFLALIMFLNVSNFSNAFFDGYGSLAEILSIFLNIIPILLVLILRVMYPLNMSKLMHMLPKTEISCEEYLQAKYIVHTLYPSIFYIGMVLINFIFFGGVGLYLFLMILTIVLFNAIISLNIVDGGALVNYGYTNNLKKYLPNIKHYNMYMGVGEFFGIINITILANFILLDLETIPLIICTVGVLLQFICFYKLYFKMRFTLFEEVSNYELVQDKKMVKR